MFKRTQRFSFRRGAPKAKRIHPLFIVRFQKATDTPHYGVVTGKNVSKKAVLRNRTKRVFLDALKEVVLKTPNTFDLVFFLRMPAHEYTKSAIIGEIENTIISINKNP